MGAVLVPIVLVLIVVVLGIMAMKRFTRAEVDRSDRLQSADRPTLRYEVPAGQDPARVLTGLREAGYEVSADSEPGPSSPIVIIGTPTGTEPDREDLRGLLTRLDDSNVNPEDSPQMDRPPVRFADEV
jgi:hypothetical protein